MKLKSLRLKTVDLKAIMELWGLTRMLFHVNPFVEYLEEIKRHMGH